MRAALIALAALLASPAAAQDAPPSSLEQAQLQAIGARGRLLYDLDRAAWVATDDLLLKLRDPANAGMRGYVVERDGAEFVVTFFGGPADDSRAIYVARVRGGKVVSGELLAPDRQVALTPVQARLAAARSIPVPADIRPCTAGPFNAAVLPPASPDGPIEMYLTSPQVERNVYPLGGHFLLTIGADGQVQSVRKYTNSCINMQVDPRSSRKGEPVAMVVTHVLDPVPTEIHVFMSLSAGKPIYVGTSDPPRMWSVEGDRIRPVTVPASTRARPRN